MTFITKMALLIAIVLWASAFVGIRAGLEGYSPGGLAVLRFIVAAISMLFIYLRFAKRDHIPIKDKLLLLLFGAIGIGGYNAALNFGETSVQSGAASFIISQSPIISTIFAVLFLNERFNLLGVIGMMISVFGVLLISVSQTNGFHFSVGIFYILTAMIIGGFYTVIQKPFLKKYHSIDVTSYMVWGGTLSLLIYMPNLLQDIHSASSSAFFSAVYLGIFPGAIAYVAWSYVLSTTPASRASCYLYFMPVMATLLGWVWLSEVPLAITFLGGLIALLGVWIVNRSYSVPINVPVDAQLTP